MDEKRLRRQLIRLFAVTTALILAAVFASLSLLSVREARQRDRESFLSLFTAVADQLQTESTLSHSYLRKYEQESGLRFCITDAGKPAITTWTAMSARRFLPRLRRWRWRRART